LECGPDPSRRRHDVCARFTGLLPGNPLRICCRFDQAWDIEGALNCNRCEKCAHTTVVLVLGGMDPSSCGLVVDEESIGFVKGMLFRKQLARSHLAMWWGPMQGAIPERLEGEMFGLAGFLSWFRDIDLGDGLHDKPPVWSIPSLYSMAPYRVALAIRSLVYGIIGEPLWVNRRGKKSKAG
jgi:hypothetical protein